ncbi:hypothetical protein ACFPN4_04420, partial [Ureibacillus thermophilus]|uniref:hypothetical protein n=1 Tax=Ureibacillus thermophilus TaxID=367743 RepID=UPI0036060927
LSENKNRLGEPRISPKPSDYILPNNVTKIYSPTPFDKEPFYLIKSLSILELRYSLFSTMNFSSDRYKYPQSLGFFYYH